MYSGDCVLADSQTCAPTPEIFYGRNAWFFDGTAPATVTKQDRYATAICMSCVGTNNIKLQPYMRGLGDAVKKHHYQAEL